MIIQLSCLSLGSVSRGPQTSLEDSLSWGDRAKSPSKSIQTLMAGVLERRQLPGEGTVGLCRGTSPGLPQSTDKHMYEESAWGQRKNLKGLEGTVHRTQKRIGNSDCSHHKDWKNS